MQKMDPENMWRGTVPLLSRSDLLIAVIPAPWIEIPERPAEAVFS